MQTVMQKLQRAQRLLFRDRRIIDDAIAIFNPLQHGDSGTERSLQNQVTSYSERDPTVTFVDVIIRVFGTIRSYSLKHGIVEH